MAMSDQSSPPVYYAVPPDPARPDRIRALALGALAGVIIGAGGVGVGWALTSHSPATPSAAAHSPAALADNPTHAACLAIRGDTALPATMPGPSAVLTLRWQAATILAESAHPHSALGTDLATASTGLDGHGPPAPEVKQAFGRVRASCGWG